MDAFCSVVETFISRERTVIIFFLFNFSIQTVGEDFILLSFYNSCFSLFLKIYSTDYMVYFLNGHYVWNSREIMFSWIDTQHIIMPLRLTIAWYHEFNIYFNILYVSLAFFALYFFEKGTLREFACNNDSSHDKYAYAKKEFNFTLLYCMKNVNLFEKYTSIYDVFCTCTRNWNTKFYSISVMDI